MKKGFIYLMCFFVAFLVYVYTSFPTVAPYRDVGEMATVLPTLSIPHPPSYPIYVILGKIFVEILPFGNIAYRLNVFSGFFSAISVYLLLTLFKFITQYNLSYFYYPLFVLPFTFSYLQWYLSLVSEMYTLGILFAILFLLVLFSRLKKKIPLLGFLLGLGMCNRLDMVFLFPTIITLSKRIFNMKRICIFLLFLFIGLSPYFLFLAIRAKTQPLINWNKPTNIERIVSTLTRKAYGGALDLISAGYRSGENFLDGMNFFVKSFIEDVLYVGIIPLVIGIISLSKHNPKVLISVLIFIFLSGPFFIYTANMPPNPHAFAILEAHFLLPFLGFYILLGYGMLSLIRKSKWYVIPIFSLSIFMFFNNCKYLNKRDNFFAYDFTINLMRSAEKNSIIVLKEDVQLFSMWYAKYINKKRNDLTIVAHGLSGSDWFVEKIKNENLNTYLIRLESPHSWKEFLEMNKCNIYIGGDVEYNRINGIYETANSLLTLLSKEEKEPLADVLLDDIYIYRGRYDYLFYREFFTPDLIEEYFKANMRYANYLIGKNEFEKAKKILKRCISYYRSSPYPYSLMGYIYYVKGDFIKSEIYYEDAVKLYKSTLEKAKKYKTFPEVVESIKRDLADVLLNAGVVKERLNKIDEPLEYYNAALNYNPKLWRAYYNKAVIYWKLQDWEKAIFEFENALKLEPENEEVRHYLGIVRSRVRK